MNRKLQAVLLFLLITLFSCREEPFVPDTFGFVFGEVVVEGTNELVADATVSTNPPTSIIQTGEQGQFAFEDIKTGSYTLRVERSGFITKVENISVLENHSTNVVVRLISDSLANNAPTMPTLISPDNLSKENELDVILSWEATDPDGDNLTYDVKLFNSDLSLNTVLAENISEPFYELTELEYEKSYFWQIIVKDGTVDVNGDIWNFETKAFPDYRILFARQTSGKFDVYAGDEEGNIIQMTNGTTNSWRPRMNPQRDKIAYLSNEGLETHIYVMNRNGTEKERITTIPVSGSNSLELDFTWAPSGFKVLYMSGNKLYTVNIDGTGTELFAEGPNGFTYAEVDWNLAENKVIARLVGDNPYNSVIHLHAGDGDFEQSLLADIPGSSGGAMLSLVGDEMLYTHDVSGYEVFDGRQLDARIFTRGLTVPVPFDLSSYKESGTNDLDPRYSPDGAFVIFVNTNNDGISQKDIYKMDLDGDNRVLLFENAEMPDWK